MKKSVSSLLAGLIALLVLPTLLASPAHAVDTEIPCSLGGTFTVSDTKVKAWNQSCLGAITIPAEVTELEYLAFYNSGVTSITFESGSRVKRIGWEAFKISKITSIVLPSGLEYLGASVFNGTGVKTISIPGTVTELDNAAFLGGPESVIFESRVATSLNLGGLLFADVQSGVGSVTFKGPNQLTLDTPPGVGDADFSLGWSTTSNGPLVDFPLANTNPGDLTLYPKLTPTTGAAIVPCSLSGTFRVKEGVVTGSSPNCAGEITVPADVTHINEYGFERRDLTSVSFETGSVLKSIGRSAFAHANISSLVLPPDLEEISYNAFTGLKATSIVIPGKVYYIWDEAFSDTSLESVVFASRPNQDARIRRNVFDNNSRLRSLTFEGPINFDPSTYQFTRRAWNWLGWSTTLGGPIMANPAHLRNNSGTITLFANSAPQTYNATYDSKGGTPVEPGLVVGGQIQFPTPPTRVGYSFDAWYLGSDPVTLWEQAGDVTLSANWIPNTYAVNLDSKGGSAVPAVSYVTDGAITSAPAAPTRDDYAFLGWSATDGGTVLTYPYSPGLMEDITLYAKWRKMSPEITAGTTPNSQVATMPAGLTDASIPATASLPRIRFVLPVMAGDVVATIAPTANPATPTTTPFIVSGSTKVVDINITGITGNVTVCLDGGPTDELYHYTGGAWVKLPERSYANGQVCGVTSSFSPFTAATPAPFKPRLSGSPAISGNARQNTLLTSTTGTWSALPAATTSAQWYRCDKSVAARKATITDAMKCLKITGATKSSYKVVLADQGKHLTVLTQAKNKMGSTFSTAKSVLVPKATKPALKSIPRISGTAAKGKVVTLGAGTWSANPTPTTTMQWYRCDKPVSVGMSTFSGSLNCAKIPGATKSKYTIAAADQAKYLTALVSGKNSQGVVAKSAKSVKVPGTKPTAKSSPKISGTAVAGSVLRVSSGSWSAIPEATTSQSWYRCASAVSAGATSIAGGLGCIKIGGATGSSYTVKLADEGKYLTVLVTAKNAEGNASTTAKSVFVKVPVVTP